MADKKKEKGPSTPRNIEVINRLYKREGNRMVRQKRDCPKCGPGTFMAQHKDRVSCGKCGYTEFKKGA
jgi:small subunit ribosomal protein S27Ae